MQVKDDAIVLKSVKYADKKYIVKLFTKNNGIVSCHAVISNSPKSKIKFSSLMPLNLISIEIISKQNKDVQNLVEVNSSYIYSNSYSDFRKLSILQFLTEVLNKVLKEQIGNDELFQFISHRLVELNELEENLSSFHHRFLIDLLYYFGINPINDCTNSSCYFDCREGKFSPLELPFPLGLNKETSELLHHGLKSNLQSLNLNALQREMLLEGIIAYYKIHLPGFNELKSLSILREISIP